MNRHLVQHINPPEIERTLDHLVVGKHGEGDGKLHLLLLPHEGPPPAAVGRQGHGIRGPQVGQAVASAVEAILDWRRRGPAEDGFVRQEGLCLPVHSWEEQVIMHWAAIGDNYRFDSNV